MAEVGMAVSDEFYEQEDSGQEEVDSGLPDGFVGEQETTSPDEEVGDLGEEEVEESAEEGGEAPESEEPKPGSRAQERIRSLNATNKELQQQLQLQQRQFQQHMAQLQSERESQMQKYQQEQLELQRQQLEIARQKYEKESEADLSELDKFKRSILSEAKTETDSILGTRLKSVEEKLREAEEAQKKAVEAEARRKRVEYFSRQAETSSQDVVLKEFDPTIRGKLNDRVKDLVMTYSAAFGADPAGVAPQMKKLFDEYAEAKMQARANSGKKATKVSGAPTSKMSGPAPKQARRGKWPSRDQLRAAHYDSVFDWVADGEPPLNPAG